MTHYYDIPWTLRLKLRIGSFFARKIGNVWYHPSIWMSNRPEHRIMIAVAELKAQGWRDPRYAPEHEDVLVIEAGSSGHHTAFRDGHSWWVRAPSHIMEDDPWPCYPLLWKLKPITKEWLDENPDYTCGCGLYVHPSKRSPKQIHIDDCPFK